MTSKQLRVILLGSPGAGKGTQAELLAAAAGVPHISTGDMFRHAVTAGSAVGLAAASFMERGELVPDDVTIGVVEERLRISDARRGFVMDGFPRTAQQATAFDALLAKLGWKLDAAIEFAVPRIELLRRLTARWTCPSCGVTYNLDSARPRVPGICDRCASALVQRADDSEATVAIRLDVYERQTAPLLAYYRGAGSLITVDGTQSVEAVHGAVMRGLASCVEAPAS
ncbi:MAG TPA: adenylate kinase [Candidatus Eremiobacteraceae bacterium]|nr:adenylate kinase [Candidatus Eremiobacteraceae bacterium]